MLNWKAQPYKLVKERVKDAVLSEHARLFEPMNNRGREAMPREVAAPLQPANIDEHSLFLTFSNGFPLQERQVFDFFNLYYAPDVERVIIPKPRGGNRPALHGRVVFKNTLISNIVMRDREKVCFSINGLPVYCRRYVSKKTKPATTASTSRRDGGSHYDGEE